MQRFYCPNMNDPRDTFWNGAITAIATPIVCYAILHGIGLLLAATVLENWGGFTEKFKVIVGICGNFIPFQIFVKQERGYAMRGLMTVNFILIFGGMWYFRRELGILGYSVE